MNIFNLPKSTEFGRVIPKKAFDVYTNTKQKKAFANVIKRISWTHKLSTKTTNLISKEVKEIQVFYIELKSQSEIKNLIEIIQKAIQYHVILVVQFENEIYFSTSAKHEHISKLNEQVIDCTFKSNGIPQSNNKVELKLSESLDWTFINFCNQLTGRNKPDPTYSEFVVKEVAIKNLEQKIKSLESKLNRESQFNKRVALNMDLTDLKKELNNIINQKA